MLHAQGACWLPGLGVTGRLAEMLALPEVLSIDPVVRGVGDAASCLIKSLRQRRMKAWGERRG